LDYLVKKNRDRAIGIDSGLLSLHLENLADQHDMAANEAVQVSRRNAGVDDLLTHGEELVREELSRADFH
jgi:hypothetical protein